MGAAGPDIVASACRNCQNLKKCFEPLWKIKRIQTNPEFQAKIIQSFKNKTFKNTMARKTPSSAEPKSRKYVLRLLGIEYYMLVFVIPLDIQVIS